MATDYEMLYTAIQENTAAIQAQTIALQENAIATKERIELERSRDNLLAEQNALIAICAKLIIASMDENDVDAALCEAITSLKNFGYKSTYLEELLER